MKYFGAVLISICCAFLTDASPDRKACSRACTREMDPICGYDGQTYKIFGNPCVMKVEVCTTGLSWTEARMADCLQSADKPEHCLVPCTKEYDPVCASNGKEFKIFPNKCTVKNGRCEDGANWFETRMSDCSSERSYDEDTYARLCGKPCTREYSPVCGTNGDQVKQFPNKCLLQKERCIDGRNWHETRMTQCTHLPVADEKTCETICTREFDQVCGYDGQGAYKIFSNPCLLKNEHCKDGNDWIQTKMTDCATFYESYDYEEEY